MQKIIWVIGVPRSGTSFLTDYIGTKTDHCFNEPWTQYPLGKHEKWNLPKATIVFKYCANCFYYKEIKNKYPNSKWIHIVRNPFNVLYSMVFPKKNSMPKREWAEMGQGSQRIINCFRKWKTMFSCCLRIKECYEIQYEQIDFKSLSDFIEIKLEKPKFINNNKIFEKEKMDLLKKVMKDNKLNINLFKKIY